MHLGLVSLLIVSISCAPHNYLYNPDHPPLVQVDSAGIEHLAGYSYNPRYTKWHLEPLGVAAVSKRKFEEANADTFSEVKQKHRVFTDINGNRQGYRQERQQGRGGY